jgi:hypothetical protein
LNEEILQLLDAAIEETHRLGRADLAGRLASQRDQVTSGAWHVLVAGEFKKGKSALVNALLGVPVCGADAAAFTSVPTIIRYGTDAGAEIVLDSGQRRRIDVRSAARYALAGSAEGDIPLQAVEVTLPRELLRDGLVLVDTPGIGGGFAAAQAAATMRAMSLADCVLIVSDASQEYTAAEVEFLRRAAEICPHLLCLLTKTDFYPEWQKILEINRGHLRRAGLKVEILPVSAVLRDEGVQSGDPALNGESGFPTLVARLRGQLAVQRAERSAGPATDAVRSCMRQVAGTLTAEHEALTQPEQRTAAIARADRVQERARTLVAPSSRWLNVVNDRFADLQSTIEEDLQARIRTLDAEAAERIRGGDPARQWAEFVPWLYQRTNDELTDCHQHLLGLLDTIATEVAGLFADDAADVGRIAGGISPPTAGEGFALQKLNVGGAGKLELAMHAARGWSLSSSVITTMLVATLHPGLLVILPITAALGSVFGVKAVRGFKTARLEQGRNEALRSVANYLNQARVDANRAALNILRHARSQLRDYYLDRANELAATADATQRAVRADATTARERASETANDLARVHGLLTAAERTGRR